MKTDLLCVESPLQLLNAYEAIEYFNLQNFKILIRYSNSGRNDDQIKKLVKTFELNKVNIEYININTSKKTPFDLLKLLLYKYRFIFNKKKFNKIFIGNPKSGFFSLIIKQFKKSQIILLDDGAKTINIQQEFSDNFHYDLFTMYELSSHKNQKIYFNKFSYIKERFFNNNMKIEDDKILFLGSKLSEINIISEDYYLQLINYISNFYKDKSIIYIPHREENPTKLIKINKIQNIKIKTIDYPIELYGLFENTLPKTISSFYSTALLTMKEIYPINVESFKFNYEGSKYSNDIANIYAFYNDKIKIINLKKYV